MSECVCRCVCVGFVPHAGTFGSMAIPHFLLCSSQPQVNAFCSAARDLIFAETRATVLFCAFRVCDGAQGSGF